MSLEKTETVLLQNNPSVSVTMPETLIFLLPAAAEEEIQQKKYTYTSVRLTWEVFSPSRFLTWIRAPCQR